MSIMLWLWLLLMDYRDGASSSNDVSRRRTSSSSTTDDLLMRENESLMKARISTSSLLIR